MHSWTFGRRTLIHLDLAQKCLCQQISPYAQPSLTFHRQNSLLIKKSTRTPLFKTSLSKQGFSKTFNMMTDFPHQLSTSSENGTDQKPIQMSKKDKLKRAVKDYGVTVIVFHVTISLMSLGISYLVISSGVDIASLLSKVGLNSSELTTGASTFVVAYAVHKVFAPIRISITLGCTPFIVRYLRTIGILKPPKPPSS